MNIKNNITLMLIGSICLDYVSNLSNATLLNQDDNKDDSIISSTTTSISNLTDTIKQFKPWEFKAGIGMDISTNGLAVGAMANLYRNFTPNIAGFAGVDYRYNVLQFKHSKEMSSVNFEATTRTKMDLLFKLGARFKVNNSISLSPYAILGMGVGSVRQESRNFNNKEVDEYLNTKEYTTLRKITTINNETNKYDLDEAKGAVQDVDVTKHKDHLTDIRVLDIDSIKELNGKYVNSSGSFGMNNNYNHYVSEMHTQSNDYERIGCRSSEINFVVFKNNSADLTENMKFISSNYDIDYLYGHNIQGKQAGRANVKVFSNGFKTTEQVDILYFEENIYKQYTYNGDNSTKVFIMSNDEWKNVLNRDVEQTENLDKGEDVFNASYYNSAYTNMLKDAVFKTTEEKANIVVDADNSFSGASVVYDDKLRMVKIKNKITNEDIGYLFYSNNESEDDIKQQIKDFNKLAVVDERTELRDGPVVNEENRNDRQQTLENTTKERSTKTEYVKTDKVIDNKNKVFFKGGLGLEMTIKNRFFLRLEYKYSQLGATNNYVYITDYENVNHNQTYNTDYTRTITKNVTNVYDNKYEKYSFNTPLTAYNKMIFRNANGDESVNGIKIKTGDINAEKGTEKIVGDTYNYGEKQIIDDTTVRVNNGRQTRYESKSSTFHMHEVSFGFGFYFL